MTDTNTTEQPQGMTVVTDAGNVTWFPHVDVKAGAVGWMAVHESTGAREFVYLVPSSEIDSGGGDRHADVFLYHGTEGDPCQDGTVCFIDMFVAEVELEETS